MRRSSPAEKRGLAVPALLLAAVAAVCGCRQPAIVQAPSPVPEARGRESGNCPRARLGLSAKVVDVRCSPHVPIDCGADSGLAEGDVFELRRGGTKLGRARVATLWPKFAGLKLVDGVRWQAGDEAVLIELASEPTPRKGN